ncbi:MAG: glycosyltransferase family 1 protein [Planctomycetota bacterium]|nr:glycosyltransferase family 1 protein [Planctomycetota bacterium]
MAGLESVCINWRSVAGGARTGVQRYAMEVAKRLPVKARLLAPDPRLRVPGIGHAWEQLALPIMSRGEVLWSPCNLGPAVYARQVVTVHDCAPADHPEWFSRRFSGYYHRLWSRLLPRVRCVLADSVHTRQRILSLFSVPESQVRVVYPGVSEAFLEPGSVAMPGDLQALQLPSRYVLCLGSVEPRKNLPNLMRAWAQIADSHPGVELLIVGGRGPQHIFSAVRLDAEVKRVRFLGRVADELLPVLYAQAEAFVYPSLYEGFGLPPLEAMAAGAPVVCSNRTSLPEVVGDAAVQVNPDSVSDIGAGIDAVLSDGSLRSVLRVRGRARAARFTWGACARQIAAILEAC